MKPTPCGPEPQPANPSLPGGSEVGSSRSASSASSGGKDSDRRTKSAPCWACPPRLSHSLHLPGPLEAPLLPTLPRCIRAMVPGAP